MFFAATLLNSELFLLFVVENKNIMQYRFELQEFCMGLCGRNSYLSDMVGKYQREYLELDIEFTSHTLGPSFHFICRDVFTHKPIKNGHVIAVLGFADTIHRRYSHISLELLV